MTAAYLGYFKTVINMHYIAMKIWHHMAEDLIASKYTGKALKFNCETTSHDFHCKINVVFGFLHSVCKVTNDILKISSVIHFAHHAKTQKPKDNTSHGWVFSCVSRKCHGL
jgi:hypothetical protein